MRISTEYPNDSTFAANVYDAGLLLTHAIPVAARSGKPGTPAFRAALRDALESTSELVGIQGVFNIREGSLGFADSRANGDLQGFFNFSMQPRPFQKIAAPVGASFFLNDKRPPEPPDND